MKKQTGKVTLGIGDGGNDVIMIQNSDVGVGVVGKEGQQAARAADYVISEFKHLKRLLCVHGVDSVSRSWTITNYSVFKSVVFCLGQTSYSFFSSYSGVSLFNSFQVTLYNILLFVPIVSMVTKRLHDQYRLLHDPSIYRYYNGSSSDQRTTLFTFREFLLWVFFGIVEVSFSPLSHTQGLLLEVVTIAIAPSATMDYLANTVFFGNLFSQDLIMLMLLPNVTWLNFWCVVFCHVCMWGFCFLFSCIPAFQGFVPTMSMQ